MNISKECYLCIYNQVYKISEKFDDKLASQMLREGAKILSKYDLSYKPPIIAAEIYSKISEISGVDDLFKKEKKESIKEALKFKNILESRLNKSKNRLLDAIKIAASGNIIDFGVNREFNLEKEIKKIFEMEFAKNDFEIFSTKLSNAKTICYLADNAGENIFDEILIKEIKNLNKKIYYIVRGKPIINDVTINDLKALEIFDLADVIDSGVDTPGFCLERANKDAKEIFKNADLVISKGMGNFECLYNEVKREVFYLFKIKCPVVARACGDEVGNYMFLKGE